MNLNDFSYYCKFDGACYGLARLESPGSILGTSIPVLTNCCGQLWVRHMICGQTCDGLYHFTFYLIVLGYHAEDLASSLVVRLYSEIDHISTLAVKLSVSAIFYPRWTATQTGNACQSWTKEAPPLHALDQL